MAKARYLNDKLPKIGSTIIVVALNKDDAFFDCKNNIINCKFKVMPNNYLKAVDKNPFNNGMFNLLVWDGFRCKVIN